ncbi:MAG: hypothetical protein KGL17_07950, partial [Betaproteobacteria bacterium]|nr:hypothetical protein [Betaproteobacteria bacterium]
TEQGAGQNGDQHPEIKPTGQSLHAGYPNEFSTGPVLLHQPRPVYPDSRIRSCQPARGLDQKQDGFEGVGARPVPGSGTIIFSDLSLLEFVREYRTSPFQHG